MKSSKIGLIIYFLKKHPLDVLFSLPQFALGWKLGGVNDKGRSTPKSPRLLTQRALLAHGVLMLEGMVGKLRRVVRRRVTVARSPVEGDCAVSCGRGGEKHSVNRETGTVDLNQNPRGGALGAPIGSQLWVTLPHTPPGLSARS